MLLSNDYNHLKLLHHNTINHLDHIPSSSASFKIDDILSNKPTDKTKLVTKILNENFKRTNNDNIGSFQENNSYDKTVSNYNILNQQQYFNSQYLINANMHHHVQINEHLYRNLDQEKEIDKISLNFQKNEQKVDKKKLKKQNKTENPKLDRKFIIQKLKKDTSIKLQFFLFQDNHIEACSHGHDHDHHLPMCLRGVTEQHLNLAHLFNTLIHHKKCRRTRTVFTGRLYSP
jgi:hypothetical protein